MCLRFLYHHFVRARQLIDRHRSFQGYICLHPWCGAMFPSVRTLDEHQQSHFTASTTSATTESRNRASNPVNNPSPLASRSTPFGAISQGFRGSKATERSVLGAVVSRSTPASNRTIASLHRHACSFCKGTFSRLSDLERHTRSHQADAVIHCCPFSGCQYKGHHRKDKLEQHIRNRHQT